MSDFITLTAASRVKKVFDQTSGHVFASGPSGTDIQYHPHGAVMTMDHSATASVSARLRQTSAYTNRLQPDEIKVEKLDPSGAPTLTHMQFLYGFNHGVANNGNVMSMVDTVQGITYAYAYDELNRLKTADAVGGASPWGYSYGYDIWGNFYNRTVTAGTGTQLIVTPQWNNQMAEYSYDASGNMMASPMGGETLVYDAENLPSPRLWQAGPWPEPGLKVRQRGDTTRKLSLQRWVHRHL